MSVAKGELAQAARHITLPTVAACSVIAIGIAARIWQVDYSFEGDEVFSVNIARQGIAEVITEALRDTPHPPLHLLLLHVWLKTFGVSEVSARALSVLFSAGFLIVSWALVRRILSPQWSIFPLAMLAIGPLFVYYGQQARPYALIAFLGAANLLALFRATDKPDDRKRLAAWGLSGAALVYTQYVGVPLIGLEIVLALVLLRVRGWKVAVVGALACISIAPWLLASMGGALFHRADPLPQIDWLAEPTVSDLVWYYVVQIGEVPYLQARWSLGLLAIVLALFCFGLVRKKRISRDVAILLVIAFGFPLVVWAISVGGPKPIFVPRQLLVSCVAFILVLGNAVSTIWRPGGAAVAAAFVVWAGLALPSHVVGSIVPPWREIAREIDQRLGNAPVITLEHWARIPLQFYRRAGDVLQRSVPADPTNANSWHLACRPFKCSLAEQPPAGVHTKLVQSWRWNRSHPPSPFNQFRLYEIAGQ